VPAQWAFRPVGWSAPGALTISSHGDALTAKTAFGSHTPWVGEEQIPVVAAPESSLERTLSERIMQGADKPAIRQLSAGDYLFRQADEATSQDAARPTSVRSTMPG